MMARQLAADEARRLTGLAEKVFRRQMDLIRKNTPLVGSSSLAYATAWDGSPLFLLTLSHHTQNAMRDRS